MECSNAATLIKYLYIYNPNIWIIIKTVASTELYYQTVASTELYYQMAASTELYYQMATSTEPYYQMARRGRDVVAQNFCLRRALYIMQLRLSYH